MSPHRIPIVWLIPLCLATAEWLSPSRAQAVTVEEVERQIAWLVNYERLAAGCRQLGHDEALSNVARAHSAEMAALGYLGHESPTEGRTLPLDRVLADIGMQPALLLENVVRVGGPISATTPARIHAAFMLSPADRANILNPEVSLLGIGVAVAQDGRVYATQLLAKPGGAPVATPVSAADEEHAASTEPVDSEAAPLSNAGAVQGLPLRAPLGAQTAGDTRGVATAPTSGVSRPVKIRLWHGTLDPASPLELSVPVRNREGVRVTVSGPPDSDLQLVCTLPGRLGTTTWLGLGTVSTGPGERVFASGDCHIRATTSRAGPCRLLVVTGPLHDVQRYGNSLRGPTPLHWDEPVQGSLGDGGGLETYTFSLSEPSTGALIVRPLDKQFRASLSLHDDHGQVLLRIRREPDDGPFTFPLQGLQPGDYTLVLLDPEAGPRAGDFEVTLSRH